MDKESVLLQLVFLLRPVRYCREMLDELLSLIAEAGIEPKVFALLITRIHQLNAMGAQAVRLKEFESIGDGLFSMHLTGKDFNLRILYSFLPSRAPVLLLAFHERAGKNKTDYSAHTDAAKARLTKLKGEYHG